MEPEITGSPEGQPPKRRGSRKGIPNKKTVERENKRQAYEKALEVYAQKSTTWLIRFQRRSKEEAEVELARHALWKRGDLRWLLRPVQLKMYHRIKRALRRGESLKYVINSSRRLGKSFLLCVIASEYAIQKQDNPVLLAAPTQKSLRKIVRPLFRQIFKTCPYHLRPHYDTADAAYRFPGGGEIQIAGTNGDHEDDLRGTGAAICLVDEAGMIDDLDYLVEDVLVPQLLTTGGPLIMASTPPKTPVQGFVAYAQAAEKVGSYAEYTIEQSGYPAEVIEKFIREAGGRESVTCQREYFCKFVVDANYAIIPEWSSRFEVVYARNPLLFPFFHKYVSLDVGGRHKTALLFGYYDFPNAKLVIEGERIHEGPQTTTGLIAGSVREAEKTLWRMADDKSVDANNPYVRVADNNNVIMLQDLGLEHKLYFLPTSKDNLAAMVNQVRMWVIAGRIIVNPDCRELIGCLKYGIYNDTRTEFAMSKTYGHFDALAALVYMVRNIDVNTNPVPAHLNMTAADTMIVEAPALTDDARELSKLFKVQRAR